jgi:crotonobetainyl-CoA:carnitine CoA-transferase CaiB-like acyl-CoA transferase
MSSALAGTRVVDFSHVMAGPYASHLLRLLGAEVIKIESPGIGDAMRNYGADRRYDGMSPAFIAVNAGKKSLVLNLKHPPALAAVRRLIAGADVVLENFRPGVMARLGLDYESVREPAAAHGLLLGVGLRPAKPAPRLAGHRQHRAGDQRHDVAERRARRRPDARRLSGRRHVDRPDRSFRHRRGAAAPRAHRLRRDIDVAMFDAAIAFMASAVVPYLVTGTTLERTGNVGYSGQPTSAVFTAADGRQISLGVVQQPQFESLARL